MAFQKRLCGYLLVYIEQTLQKYNYNYSHSQFDDFHVFNVFTGFVSLPRNGMRLSGFCQKSTEINIYPIRKHNITFIGGHLAVVLKG